MSCFETPQTEYITIPVSNPSATRGKLIKYGYKIYGKQFLSTQIPLILLSGWTGCMIDWLDLPHLISRKRCVITVDHRGIGFSEIIFNKDFTTHFKSKNAIKKKLKRPIPVFDYNDFVSDIYYLIQYLLKDNMRKIDILGWSMGGMIAQHFTLTYPQIVNNLILFATTMGGKPAEKFRTEEFDEWKQNSTVGLANVKNRNDLIKQLKSNLKFQFGYSLKKEDENVVLDMIVNDIILKVKRPFKTIMGQYNANLKYHNNNNGVDLKGLDKYVKNFNINVIVIHGECDSVLNVGNAYYLNEHLYNSHLCILKGEGHWIHGTKSGMKQCVEIINDIPLNCKPLNAKL
eukprot:218555_1